MKTWGCIAGPISFMADGYLTFLILPIFVGGGKVKNKASRSEAASLAFSFGPPTPPFTASWLLWLLPVLDPISPILPAVYTFLQATLPLFDIDILAPPLLL